MRRHPGGERDPHDPTPDAFEPPLQRSPVEQFLRVVVRQIRRLVVLVVGMSVVLVGLIMLVTPGPALVVVPIGLGILALEFAWARRLLVRVRERAYQARADYWQWYRGSGPRGEGRPDDPPD